MTIVALLVSGASTFAATRDAEPVVISGAQLSELDGADIATLALFRYDWINAVFVPIPFQVDEKTTQLFNEGTILEFSELMYDVQGLEDGTIDADDELAFLFGDADRRALPNTPWPAGAGSVRYEIEVSDPLPPGNDQRWVYLFTGPALERSTTSYVSWNTQANGVIDTSVYQLDFAGNWLLEGYAVKSPCGNGVDLIDRVKGRAIALALQESEEHWNLNSTFLGGIVGPVRAIRYVRGADSGVNTIHHDVVYERRWIRQVNLRVHSVVEARMYVDWLPQSQMTYFSAAQGSGVTMDGMPDSGVGGGEPDWVIVDSPGGGLALVHDLPNSPLVGTQEVFYRDDNQFDDAPEPGYGDQDDFSFGNHGILLTDLDDSNTEEIPFRFTMTPLCAFQGSLALGEQFNDFHKTPLQVTTVPGVVGLGPIRDLQIQTGPSSLDLSWSALPTATSYRVYRSDDPSTLFSNWELIGETSGTSFSDPNPVDPVRFYSVVAVSGDVEGPR